VFSGESIHTLDPKNRVFVPKRFQDELGHDGEGHRVAILTRGFERCIFLFSEATFGRVLERLQTQPFGGERLRKMQRLFFANVHPTPLDSSGRVLLPEKLRHYAGIEKEVVMVGCADRGEIWGRGQWERFESDSDGDFDQLDVVLVGGAGSGIGGVSPN
jgi:MraZ protein